jgi:hypothetical protein
VASLIDWRGDAGVTTSGPQDVNFDGVQSLLSGFNDWSNVRLNHVGAGRNMAGMSIGMTWGGLDWQGLDWQGLDWQGLDWQGLDWQGLDWQGLDWQGLDWQGLDWQGLDWQGLDWQGLDWQGLDWQGLDWQGLSNGVPLDRPTAIQSGGGTEPNDMKAFVRGTNGAGGSNSSAPLGQTWVPPGEPTTCATLTPEACHQVRTDWTPPNVGPVTLFTVLRAFDPTGTAEAPTGSSSVLTVGTTSGATTTLNDPEELPNAKRFIYFSKATIDGLLRNASNFAVITAVNSAPVATDNSYTVPLTDRREVTGNVITDGTPDSDQDSPASLITALLVSGPTRGTLVFNANGSFTYTADPSFTSGTDTFTYKANNGVWSRDPSVSMSPDSNTATVTIFPPAGGGGGGGGGGGNVGGPGPD